MISKIRKRTGSLLTFQTKTNETRYLERVASDFSNQLSFSHSAIATKNFAEIHWQVAVSRIADASNCNCRDLSAGHNLQYVIALHVHKVAKLGHCRFGRRFADDVAFCD